MKEDLISRQAAIDEFDGGKVDETYCTEYDIGYNDGIDFAISRLSVMPSAQPDQRWIPVTESFPKAEKERYWVCTDTGYQCECRWTNNRFGMGESDEWGWSIFDIPQFSKVVAYMPLPEPYRVERRER